MPLQSSVLPFEGVCHQCARSMSKKQWPIQPQGRIPSISSTQRFPIRAPPSIPSTVVSLLYPARREGLHRPLPSINRRPSQHPPFSSFIPVSPRRHFRSTRLLYAEPINHYETLGLTPDASQAEIKKQFYSLSKLHHPDHNPSDPSASARFQSISSAYNILGKPAKRQQYDRDSGFSPLYNPSGPAYSGSFSSSQRGPSSSPYGARPASGLSKRRGTFRGPPPSFYASGGWGSQGEKRRRAENEGASASFRGAERPSSNGEDTESYGGSYGATYGAGGASWGTGVPGDDSVPHFDRQSHMERQEEIDERMAKRRRARRARQEEEAEALSRDWAVRLVIVVIVVGVAGAVDALVVRPTRGVGDAKREKGIR